MHEEGGFAFRTLMILQNIIGCHQYIFLESEGFFFLKHIACHLYAIAHI